MVKYVLLRGTRSFPLSSGANDVIQTGTALILRTTWALVSALDTGEGARRTLGNYRVEEGALYQ